MESENHVVLCGQIFEEKEKEKLENSIDANDIKVSHFFFETKSGYLDRNSTTSGMNSECKTIMQ